MPRALLLGYDLGQPSFRHRMQTLVPALHAAGWEVRCERFPSGRYGVRTWERRGLLRWADVSVLHQIKLSAIEARLFATFSRHRVFDFDDAIYVRKPRRLGEPPDESPWRRRKFEATCRLADEVAAGNQVLAEAAWTAARAVTILPTSIDAGAYPLAPSTLGAAAAGGPVTIVWIGSPENLVYLELVRPALARLAARDPRVRLRVICSRFPEWPEIPVERVSWSSEGEAAALAESQIGIMPLTDDAWARGKCAFKLLQYMAARLPCVASPVGANTEAVIDAVTGYHAYDDHDWERRLGELVASRELRERMGAAGHAHVERHYSMRSYRERYLNSSPGSRPARRPCAAETV
ncbi:MAG: glycosyltransferase family 4 protein [Gammaproteobacteria bacterium]|nr:glycosyltransferase family 4 protein [Gammaproteobacteria bacterium]